MANNQYSYRPNMNRNVTRKWAEARQVNYGGDDWGDDGYGPPEEEPIQQPLSYGQRSFTNPTVNPQHRMSYDREAENRVFSAGPGPAPGLPNYGPSQPGPYNGAPGHRFYDQSQQSTYEQPQYPQSRAPEPPVRTSGDSYRRDAPRPESRESASAAIHPPRKSSLGQNDFKDYSQPETSLPQAANPATAKPLPFIRPADIWKKHEEEQREKERRSQESSTRPSMDSARDSGEKTTQLSEEQEANRRRQPALDTVAERKSEYLDTSDDPSSPTRAGGVQTAPITQAPILAQSTLPSTAIPVSAVPSTTAEGRPALPQISRTSTFGPDFLYSSTQPTQLQTNQVSQPPTAGGTSSLQHNPSQGYRSLVTGAFQSENHRSEDSPTADSILRTNTTSTSNISPIVASPTNHPFQRSNRENDVPNTSAGHFSDAEGFQPPRRVNTDRRESPSPARRPQSLVAPDIPEPLSAVTSPIEPVTAPDTARAAQVVRPGLANLVHQRGPSKDFIPSELNRDTKPQTQDSMDSDTSNLSNQRSTSEEWASWNAARNEAHARHGIPDSKPPTPGVSTSSPPPPFESLDRNLHMPAGSGDSITKPTGLSALPSQRPQATRDESFRPVLPGGWTSSTSIQKAETPEPLSTGSRPIMGISKTRSESTDSIPTATAPRDANWRSQYSSGSQGGAMAAAGAAGAAMAGIFNGPSLTLTQHPESEVSSIYDEEGPTGLHRDASMKSHDFAASSEPPQMSEQSAARDFAATSPSALDTTPKAKQTPFKTSDEGKPALSLPGQAIYSLPHGHASHDSPTKESERWWSSSEDEAEHTPAPAPLRTNRLSTIEPSHSSISPVSRHTDADNDRLESDIVKSLTPKSSNIKTNTAQTGGISRVQERNTDKSVSPPFAAAALAVSPGRDYHALEEQNAFNPLTAPSSKTISPTNKGMAEFPAGLPPASSMAVDRQPQPILSRPVTPPPPITLPVTKGQDHASEAPSLPAFDKARTGPVNQYGSKPESRATDNDFVHDEAPSILASKAVHSGPNDSLSSGSGVPLPATGSSESAVAQQHGASTANDTVRSPAAANTDLTRNQPITPAKDLSKPTDVITNPVIRQPSLARSEVSAISAPASPQVPKTVIAAPAYDPLRAFPSDKFTNEQIGNMESPHHRINAYNENRTAYAQPVGHLENWLTHMNTPERADAFVSRPMGTTPYSSNERFDKRDSSGPPSASKMQEDGKRLLSSASKMGQKASVLGKGFFTKGKEKLRTVSASQKGSSISSQSTERIVPETRQQPTAPPQLPEHSSSTPLEETSLSTYFSGRDEPTTTTTTNRYSTFTGNDPPFSPISEVSSNQIGNQKGLERTVSAVSEQQSPQSDTTARPSTTIARPSTHDEQPRVVGAIPQTRSTAPLGSVGLLTADKHGHHRSDSSVSDVSSVSDRLMRNQSQATRTISPQVEPHHTNDISAPPTRNISTTLPARDTQSTNKIPIATDMAAATLLSKEDEARQDRVEEPTLPAYEQARPQQPRVAQGAQIVPIARIHQNQDSTDTTPSRPFSFVGNESLSKTGYPTNQSMDNPGVSTESSATRRDQTSPSFSQQYQQENPLPSARRNPEEYAAHARTPEEFARLRQQAPVIQTKNEDPSTFRIPGPYGQQLRSPKPRTASPIMEQSRNTPLTTSHGESHGTALAATGVLAAAAYGEHNRPGDHSHQPYGYQDQSQPGQQASQSQSHYDPNWPVEQHMQPQHQQEIGPDMGLTHRRSLATSLAEHEREVAEERRERSRTSKLTSMFRTRSRSRSRRLRKEQHGQGVVEQRPGASKRNSLLQTTSRTSIPQAQPQAQSATQAPSWYTDEVADYDTQASDRPGAGTRRLSKDLFKNAQYGQQGLSQPHANNQYQQQPYASPAANAKKKRFSGLFGKSSRNEQALSRSSTMPIQAQQGYQNQHQYQQQQEQQRPAEGPAEFHRKTTFPQGFVPHLPHVHGHDQQHPAMRKGQPGQPLQGMTHPGEGYYDGRPGNLNRQSSQPYGQSYGGQQPMSSSNPLQQTADPLSQGSRGGQFGLGHQQVRPDLPRLDTGDRDTSITQPSTTSYGPNIHSSMATSHPLQQNQPIYSAPARATTIDQGHQPPVTRVNKDISYGSDFVPRSNTLGSGPAPATGVQSPAPLSADTGTKITPRVAALHTRSRSPKLGRRDSTDLNEEFSSIHNTHSPVANLGTFHNKKVSPAGGIPRQEGEQEKPWSIGLPGTEGQRDSAHDDPSSAASSKAREMRRIMLERSPVDQQTTNHETPAGQTVADRFMGIPASAPAPTKYSTMTSPVSAPPVPNVMITRNPSMRGREPVNRSTSTTPVNTNNAANGNSMVASPTRHHANLANDRPPVPSLSSAKAVQAPSAPLTSPPAPPQPRMVPPVAPPVRALTPPEPSISPPPPPQSMAAAPTTTNEAGHTKTMPKQTAGKSFEMHELPGSRPDGYESEEEIVMSATAFPGQEWMPVFERWED